MRQEVTLDDPVGSGQRESNLAGKAASSVRRGSAAAVPSLPKEGEQFTEEQMSERFGVSPPGGIRISKTSSDIVLVSRVDVSTSYDDKDSGEYVYYDGYPESADRMADWRNKALSESSENGSRVLFFVKDGGKLAFHGRVECAGWEYGDRQGHGRVAIFKMRRVNDAMAQPASLARYATVVSIVEDEDGGYVATAPTLPACISQGETRAEAQENLAEAISLYLEYLLEAGESLPPNLAAPLDIAAINVRGESVSAKVSGMQECMQA